MNAHAHTLTLAVVLSTSSAALAADIRALITLPAQPVVQEIAPAFEKASGHKLAITYSGGQDTRKRMAANEEFDVIIAPKPDVQSFAQDGKLTKESVVDLLVSQIGVAVKAGFPKPELTETGIRDALVKAKTIGYSTGSSGDHLQKTILPRLGLADQVKAKLKQVSSGEAVGTLLASGDAEIGIQQVSQLINLKGVEFVGPLPDSLQLNVIYSGAVFTKSGSQQAGRDFLRLIASPQGLAAARQAGLTPAR